jgi:ACR3 family arsenite efflux pump ArsB
MSRVERLQSVLVLAAAATGLALGRLDGVATLAERVVIPALILLLVAVFLPVTAKGIGDAVRHKRVLASSLVINFLCAPVLAWLLGALLLGGQPDLRIGLLMLLVTPCTDWYLVFTSLARGNVPLATALLPLNLLLQVLLLPVYLLVLGGILIPIDVDALTEAVLVVLLVPLAIASAIRFLAHRVKGTIWLEGSLMPRLGPLSQGALFFAVAAVFAAYGHIVFARGRPLLALLPALAAFFAVNYLLAQAVGSVLRLAYREQATLTMTVLARNSPLALAVAAAAFPDRPLVTVALVFGPLVELPVLAAAAHLLRSRHHQPG